MNSLTLQNVDQKLEEYKGKNHGAAPLYIIVSSRDGDQLLEEVRALGHFEKAEFITSYRGSKIVIHDVVQKGEMILSNELPETSS